jgi:hypothetical protein
MSFDLLRVWEAHILETGVFIVFAVGVVRYVLYEFRRLSELAWAPEWRSA